MAANGVGVTGLQGRDAELRLLSDTITALGAGHGGTVVAEAPSGLGKTRLVLEAATRARHAGLAVATTGFDEFQRSISLATLTATWQDELSMTVGDGKLGDSSMGTSERFARVERLRIAIERRSRQQPILMALDDLQWADPDIVLLIRLLSPQAADGRVMWLLTRRAVPSTPELDELVGTLEANGATILRLPPLAPEAVNALALDILGAPPDEALRALLTQCGGNPLVIIEFLRTLTEHDSLIVDAKRARLIPSGSGWLYQRLILGMGTLSPPTLQMLDVASVFGRAFDVRCVAHVLGWDITDLLPSVHEAIGTGFLVEEEGQLAFRHGLIRDMTYGALPTETRRTLHMDAAGALMSVGGSSIDAGTHVVRVADAGDPDAVKMLIRVSDDVAPTAPGTAADLRHFAYQLMPDASTELVGHTSALLLRAGRTDESGALAEAALAQKPPPHVAAVLRLRLAEGSMAHGRMEHARRQLRIALQVPGVPDATRCLLFAASAVANTRIGDVDAAVRGAENAIALGNTSGSDYSLAHALLAMGIADRLRGHFTKSLERITAAVRLAESDALLHQQLEPHWERGRTLLSLDRFEEASASFEYAHEWSARLGTVWTTTLRHTCRATLALHQGRIGRAGTEAAAGLTASEQLQDGTYVPELAAILAQVDAHTGAQSRALEHLHRAGHDRTGPSAVAVQQLAWASVVVNGQDATPHSLIARTAPIYDHLADHPLALVSDTVIGPTLVALALSAGDHERAQVAATATEALHRANPGVPSLAAATEQAGGLVDNDIRRLVAAARAFQASPRPLARARAYEDVGRACVRADRQRVAERSWRAAMDEYEQIGASAPAQRARAQLATASSAGTRKGRPSFGWESLTLAELRIARLAARGLTNRAIANRLSLSPHTVDSHLRHSFHKLDVRSRVELTRLVLTQDPGPEA